MESIGAEAGRLDKCVERGQEILGIPGLYLVVKMTPFSGPRGFDVVSGLGSKTCASAPAISTFQKVLTALSWTYSSGPMVRRLRIENLT